MENCVETDELVAMLDGNLPGDRVEAVLVHVDRCASCAEVIANLARESAPRGVGRYQLGRVIGSGGMGVVHEGWDPELRRRVAVKLVRPERSDDAAHARMLREARALARISHPNVVAVYDVGEHGGEIYVATELVDGETMATWCEGRSAREIVEAWIQAARGLDAAHAGGIVHRDVKPANVLVGRDGRVRIGDFGLARLGPRDAHRPPQLATPPRGVAAPAGHSLPTVTDAGSIGGTPAYMAPEQWLGVNDPRSDQYALAVAVVESLTGKRPGDDGAFALRDGTAGGDALASALARALRAEPEARFPSVGAFAGALVAAIAPPVRRSRVAVAAAVAVAAVGAGSVVAWSTARTGPECEPRAIPAGVWSPALRWGLDWRFPRAIGEHLDAWMTGWSAAAADTCAVDGDAPVLRARRERCLDEALDQARKLLARWDADPGYQPVSAQIGVELLPRPARCSHAAAAALVEPTPVQAFAITQLRARMDLVLYVVKRDELATLREVAGAARAVGHVPFIAETAIELAKQLARADRAAAAASLREVLVLVDRAHDDFARARVATSLIATLDSDGVDEALAVAEPARAGLARLGGDAALEHDLDVALGAVLKGAARIEEALAALERARTAARNAYGLDSVHEATTLITLESMYAQRDPAAPGAKQLREAAMAAYRKLGVAMPPGESTERVGTAESMIAMLEPMVEQKHRLAPNTGDEATAMWALGNAYFLAGRLDRALEMYRRAAALYDRLKIRTTAAVDAHAHVAQVLLDTGQLPGAQDEARRAADRAVALANAIGVKHDLAFALAVQGQVRLALGDLAGAREALKPALQIRIDLSAPATQIASTQFHYAQALWELDRRLAIELATSARVLIRSYLASEVPAMEQTHVLPVQKRRLAEIDRWLDEHGR
jgi:serine/threonine protein kinase